MTIDTSILSQLRKLLIPSESVETLTELLQKDVMEHIAHSDGSMLPSGTFPTLPATGSTAWEDEVRLMAVDLGGTSLKIAIITVPNFQITYQDEYEVTDRLVNYQFFDNIVEWICQKISKYNTSTSAYKQTEFLTSITFSFPLNQRNVIVSMGKGFKLAEEIEGKDAKRVFQEAFDKVLLKYGISVTVHDIINDAVAVYLTNKLFCKEENLSLILGTGINSCFEIDPSLMPAFKRKENIPPQCTSMLVNSEAGFLGKNVIQPTHFDIHGDENKDFEMPLEMVTSGKWLPLTLKKIIQYYGLCKQQDVKYNGRVFLSILNDDDQNQFINDGYEKLASNIAQLLIQRAAIYTVSALKAINSLTIKEKHEAKTFEVGFVGSFLANSDYYQNQIASASNSEVRLHYLDNSNLIGAAIATYLSKTPPASPA